MNNLYCFEGEAAKNSFVSVFICRVTNRYFCGSLGAGENCEKHERFVGLVLLKLLLFVDSIVMVIAFQCFDSYLEFFFKFQKLQKILS